MTQQRMYSRTVCYVYGSGDTDPCILKVSPKWKWRLVPCPNYFTLDRWLERPQSESRCCKEDKNLCSSLESNPSCPICSLLTIMTELTPRTAWECRKIKFKNQSKSQSMDMQVIKCKRSFWRQCEVSFFCIVPFLQMHKFKQKQMRIWRNEKSYEIFGHIV